MITLLNKCVFVSDVGGKVLTWKELSNGKNVDREFAEKFAIDSFESSDSIINTLSSEKTIVFGFSKVEEIGNVGKCKIYVALRISLYAIYCMFFSNDIDVIHARHLIMILVYVRRVIPTVSILLLCKCL